MAEVKWGEEIAYFVGPGNDGQIEKIVFSGGGVGWLADGVFAYNSNGDPSNAQEWYAVEEVAALFLKNNNETTLIPKPCALDLDGDGRMDLMKIGDGWYTDLNNDSVFDPLESVHLKYDYGSRRWQVGKVFDEGDNAYTFDQGGQRWLAVGR